MIERIILQFFPLFCIAVIMIFMAIQDMRTRRFRSVCLLAILGMTIALAIFTELVRFSRDVWLNIPAATWSDFLSYAIRPFCLYMFILLGSKRFDKWERLAFIPLAVSGLIYLSSVFLNVPFLRDLAFHYELSEAGTALVHVRGPMNFTAHIISLIYLIGLIYLSMRQLRGKHRTDAISVLICAAFIVGAVVLEMLGYVHGLLNVTIAISSVFYYLFILKEENRRDALTTLFDRKTYYIDLERFGKKVSGVIQIDMNGLKKINDTQGHKAGDDSIKAVAETILSKTDNDMYVYRVGGDEFTVVVVNGKRPVEVIYTGIRQAIEEAGLCCAMGYAVCEGDIHNAGEAVKEADMAMYADKARFYVDHPDKDRRHD